VSIFADPSVTITIDTTVLSENAKAGFRGLKGLIPKGFLKQRIDTLFAMKVSELLSSIDSEISPIQQVRALLSGHDGSPTVRGGKAAKKRVMSADARARIAAAQPKRWATWKKTKKAA
jgi:hypothetical protein